MTDKPTEAVMHDSIRALLQQFCDIYGIRVSDLMVNWLHTPSIENDRYIVDDITMRTTSKWDLYT